MYIDSNILQNILISVMNDSTICSDEWPPTFLPYVSMVTSIILSIVTVSGNLLVCLAVLRDPNKDIKSPFTLLILNLSTADLIVGAVTDSLSITFHYKESQHDPSAHHLERVTHMCYYIFCTASLLSLAALTLDRYIALTSSNWYRSHVTTKVAGVISIGIWLISITPSWLYLNYGFIRYSFIFANTSILLTVIILLLAYLGIIRKLRKQVLDLEIIRAQNTGARAKCRTTLWEKKLTTTYLAMLVVFLTCFLPSMAAIYALNFCHSCMRNCATYHILRDAHFLLILCSSLFNPVLYGWRLPNFRRAFLSLIKCKEGVRVDVSPHNGNVVLQNQTNIHIELELATFTESKQASNLLK